MRIWIERGLGIVIATALLWAGARVISVDGLTGRVAASREQGLTRTSPTTVTDTPDHGNDQSATPMAPEATATPTDDMPTVGPDTDSETSTSESLESSPTEEAAQDSTGRRNRRGGGQGSQ